MVNKTPLARVEVLGFHILYLSCGVVVPHLERDPEAQPLHLVEGGVTDWTHAIHHIFEKVHEVCDRVGVGLQLHILDERGERHLPVEFC